MPNKANPNYHVVPRNGQWAVTHEGSTRAVAIRPTQAAAIEAGRSVAQPAGGELHIHRPDGRIRDRRSYGNDPESSKG